MKGAGITSQGTAKNDEGNGNGSCIRGRSGKLRRFLKDPMIHVTSAGLPESLHESEAPQTNSDTTTSRASSVNCPTG